jgi:hypothetical protein
MRAKPTESEALFRERLQRANIAFYDQWVIGRYIVDFVIIRKNLIVELDGGIHFKTKSKILYDKKRVAFVEGCGFKVVRVPNKQAAEYPIRHTWRGSVPRGALIHFRRCCALASARIAERRKSYNDRAARKALNNEAKAVMQQADMTPRLCKRM